MAPSDGYVLANDLDLGTRSRKRLGFGATFSETTRFWGHVLGNDLDLWPTTWLWGHVVTNDLDLGPQSLKRLRFGALFSVRVIFRGTMSDIDGERLVVVPNVLATSGTNSPQHTPIYTYC